MSNSPIVTTLDQDGFRLLRLVLIDSLSPGRIIELPLDGGAVLTGRNGRGKTSLLQLIPLFFGESPNKIVTTEAGRESFVGYYLPRTTSYIAFEYERHGGHRRMVVAYSDRAGERVFYRFIRSAYEVSLFLQENGDFVKTIDFRTHLHTHGYQFAERQIESQSEYCKIIQGVPAVTTDRTHQKYLREITQEYAFTSTKKPLKQIEKIVSGMFRRKTNFDDLQSMVIDCVSDEQATHAISVDRRKIEDWPKGYKAYTSVMSMAPKMALVEDAENKLKTSELALGEIYSKFRKLALHIDQEITSHSDEKTALENLWSEKKSHHQKALNELTGQQLLELKSKSFSEGKATTLKDAFDAYERQDMPSLDERVRNATNLRDTLSQAEKRREALLGAQSEIAARFERMKHTAKEAFSHFRDDQNISRENLLKAFDLQIHQLEEAFYTSDKLANEELVKNRKHLDEAVHSASSEHGRCLHAVDHPTGNAKALELLEKKQASLETCRTEKASVDNQRRILEDVHRQAIQAFQTQENVISACVRQVAEAEGHLVAKQKHLEPQIGTLLHFLRTEHHNWSNDIAKVIRVDILERTDLNPAMAESNNTIFGLSVDLERLDSHSASDIQQAEHDVDVAHSRHKAAQTTLENAKQALYQMGQTRETAETAQRTHELNIQKANAKVQSAQAEVDEAKRQVEASKINALNSAKLILSNSVKTLSEAKDKLFRFDELSRAENHKLRDTHNQKKREKQKNRDDEIKTLEAQKSLRQKDLEINLKRFDIERDEALLSEGVDTKKLKSLDDEISKINAEMVAIQGFTQNVQQWHYWKQNEWIKYDAFILEAAESQEKYEDYSQKIHALEKQWGIENQNFQEKIKKIGLDLVGFYEQRKLVNGRSDAMLPIVTDLPEVFVSEYDASWTFDSLSSLANQHTKEVNQQTDLIRRTIGEVASGFRMHQGTPPEQYLQTTLASLSHTPSREWIAPLKAWFSKSHQEYQRILLMDAVSIAGEVNAFHRSMEEFHLRVHQFNRELQEHLDTSLAFESISKIGVEVISTIKELKYWASISEMAETHRAWSSSGSTDLPPAEFALTIERLLEHWEIKTGIRADLKSLIHIQGEVTENGNRRVFKRASDLEAVSSNGLSYLVLATIFIAFINRIRRGAKVNIIWALDELKDLDSGNVVALVDLLERNHITLACAFPDPDPETMALFRHRFTVEPDRRLAEVRVLIDDFPEENILNNETEDATHLTTESIESTGDVNV